MSARLELHTGSILQRFGKKFQKAQIGLDNEVLKDCEPYVPFQSGALARSGVSGTKPGTGRIVYNSPYAAKQYYRFPIKTKDHHPQASMQWFEKAKAVNQPKWAKGVNRIVTGKTG